MRIVASVVLAAALAGAAVPYTAAAADPVPTPDEVLAAMAELTNPDIPAVNKGNVVTPGFSPEEAQLIDQRLRETQEAGLLPYNFVVSDIAPAPDNSAGATVTSVGGFHEESAPEPIVLSEQGGRWLITHDTALTALDHFWHNANRPFVPIVPWVK
ncbi:hypothetical protein [[Mycobacterium] holstebronense]|uniref:Low molecular weight antigen MTB12-like C-terminal domain-containing protein n=1 Tax=[Mycobacterium] holstebronense TaxID=3064288 RepID=A0ABN9MXM6_9MYCO|nr:hypothetical protein [Mycolicibacter sp. MU0102]CAJ1496865.1 hypothetical protein MU0102_000323 [Mycolicibacter sp. MU0102]